MTVTRDQAEMLTTLAIACRPDRAPTWDRNGVMAAIERVRSRSLAEVALAVIRAAADREAVNPGVIPSNGSHWNEQLKPALWQPTRGPWCMTCGRAKDHHNTPDHDYEPPADRKRTPDAQAAIVEDMKAKLALTREPDEPEPVPHDPRADEAREAMNPTTHHDERADVRESIDQEASA